MFWAANYFGRQSVSNIVIEVLVHRRAKGIRTRQTLAVIKKEDILLSATPCSFRNTLCACVC